MLWVDKYRPRTLEKLEYHSQLSNRLKKVAGNVSDVQEDVASSRFPNFPHLLFYGPNGSGKRTRVKALLRELFGVGVEKLKQDKKIYKASPTSSSRKSIEVNTVSSNYHIEINPSDYGNSDTYVIQQVIKEIAQSSPLHNALRLMQVRPKQEKKESKENEEGNVGGGRAEKGGGKVRRKVVVPFKVVVLYEADKLSKTAQHGLRRTMEKYIQGCRLMLVCQDINRVIYPLRSRCLCLRIPAPTEDDMLRVMNRTIALQEKAQGRGRTVAPEENKHLQKLLYRVASVSDRNMRRALLLLQTVHVKLQNQTQKQHAAGRLVSLTTVTEEDYSMQLPVADWQVFIEQMAKKICQSQSTQTLLDIRKDLYELLGNCIPPSLVLERLTKELLKKMDVELRHEVIKEAAMYEVRMGKGSKPIFHLEAFVAKVMYLYKRYLINCFG